jgi:predicted nucleic acid-binding Zn finger protein
MTDLSANGFYLKTGELSQYSFACGYCESAWIGEIHLEMWKEHQCYHVRAHDHGKPNGRIFWDAFDDEIGAARKRYRQALKELKKGD